MLLSRTIQLKIYPNKSKQESLRYTQKRFTEYVQHYVGRRFFIEKEESTKGLGQLPNIAQHKAYNIIKSIKASSKETGKKINVPIIKFMSCPCQIEKSKETTFDYWVSFEDQFSKKNRIRIPAKSHKRLNNFLKSGWKLNSLGELVVAKNGKTYARIYVQKEVEVAKPKKRFIGCDVGLNHCVSRSDGYLGVSASKMLKLSRDKDAERRRQKHKLGIRNKSLIHQLNVEARRAVNVSRARRMSLAVESPKVLANLKPKLQWARAYFANRCHTLGQENGVFVLDVNPAYTSQTCSRCGHVAKASRLKLTFKCVGCGNSTHADINASRVIGLKGTEIARKILAKSGSVKANA